MRPDTPQKYEFFSIENIEGQAHSLVYIKPWTQFFDLKGREGVPQSYADNISLKNIRLECELFFDVRITGNDHLSNFRFENLNIVAKNDTFNKDIIEGVRLINVKVNDNMIK
jgi:hypothetical protein